MFISSSCCSIPNLEFCCRKLSKLGISWNKFYRSKLLLILKGFIKKNLCCFLFILYLILHVDTALRNHNYLCKPNWYLVKNEEVFSIYRCRLKNSMGTEYVTISRQFITVLVTSRHRIDHNNSMLPLFQYFFSNIIKKLPLFRRQYPQRAVIQWSFDFANTQA